MRPISVIGRRANRNKALLWGALIGVAMFLLDLVVNALVFNAHIASHSSPATVNLGANVVIISLIFLALAGGFTGWATGSVGPGVLASVIAASVSSVVEIILACGPLAVILVLLLTHLPRHPTRSDEGYGIGLLVIGGSLIVTLIALFGIFVLRLVIALALGALASLIGSRLADPPADAPAYPAYPPY